LKNVGDIVSNNEKMRFSKIDAEQINIVDKNGKVRLSLFNKDNIPPVIMDGMDFLPGHRQNRPIAGLMFYNAEGDECGGLIYGSEIDENGNYRASASLTFDQYKQDQIIHLLRFLMLILMKIIYLLNSNMVPG
jgi:hypothetical protein